MDLKLEKQTYEIFERKFGGFFGFDTKNDMERKWLGFCGGFLGESFDVRICLVMLEEEEVQILFIS